MQAVETTLRDVKLLRPRRFEDGRGWFAEVFSQEVFSQRVLSEDVLAGSRPAVHFVQDNQSLSHQGVLRGLHYQLGKPQGKLVQVLSGHIWDVAVDLRRDSPDFGRWAGIYLKMESPEDVLEQVWIPEGFAHGFLVLSGSATVQYKTTNPYYPAGERSIVWDDPTLGIEWPLEGLHGARPVVSAKDAEATAFLRAELPPVG
ncbi:MAG TPA: dTDP-4-dehydrorhamnose 3,5-epimerase [Acidobacteriaceae bacterium]